MKQNETESKRAAAASNILKTLLILLSATLVCEALYRMGLEHQNIIIVMVLALFLIAAMTDRYWYGLLATPVGAFPLPSLLC